MYINLILNECVYNNEVYLKQERPNIYSSMEYDKYIYVYVYWDIKSPYI